MSNFTIVLPDVWELNKYYEVGFMLNNPDSGLDALEAAVWEFESKYDFTRWYIKADDQSYEFWIGNIAYIWEDILPWLEAVRTGQSMAELTNYAQGSEATIEIEPLGTEQVKVLIINHDTQPNFKEFRLDMLEDLQDQKHIVDKEHFILEWKMFALKLLLTITKEGFLDINHDNLRVYLTRILKI